MLGSLISGGLSLIGGAMANNANRSSAKAQMNFQEEMSNTAYQRAADDMSKAGLNRILAVGNPASTPGGAMASQSDIITPALNSGRAAMMAKAQIDNLQEQNDNIKADTTLKKTQAAGIISDNIVKAITAGLTQEGKGPLQQGLVVQATQAEQMQAAIQKLAADIGLVKEQTLTQKAETKKRNVEADFARPRQIMNMLTESFTALGVAAGLGQAGKALGQFGAFKAMKGK